MTKLEFDLAKRDLTLEKRGLDFARAHEVFQGPHWTAEDQRKPYEEVRYFTLGYLDERLVVLVWTKRAALTRIISLRKANEREQKIFRSRMD
jgi:uncharacterized DUF497 family protein